MTHIALILAIQLAGLLFSFHLVRGLSSAGLLQAETERLNRALRKAVNDFQLQSYRLTLAVVVAPALLLIVSHLAFESHAELRHADAALWSTLALLSGALFSCVATRFAASVARRASRSIVATADISLDSALSTGIRAGGSIGLFCEAISAFSLAGFFALTYAVKGGFAGARASPELLLSVITLMPVFALGTAVGAMVIQRAGSVYRVGSKTGGALGGEVGAGLSYKDGRNPAIVADLVGDYVGGAASAAADLFVTATAANVLALVLGTGIAAANPGNPTLGQAALLLPLIIKSFGLIASAFGIMVVRSEGERTPVGALVRGLITATIVVVAGVAGGCLWLLGKQAAPWFCAAALIGLVLAIASAQIGRYYAYRRFPPLRDVLDCLKVGVAPALARSLGAACQSSLLFILGAFLALAAAWVLGEASGLSYGGALSSVVMLMAILALSPFALSLASLTTLTDNARGLLAMNAHVLPEGHVLPESDLARRTVRLDDAAFSAGPHAQSYLTWASSTTALLLILLFPAMLPHPFNELMLGMASDLASPILLGSAGLGAALVLTDAGNVLIQAGRSAKLVVLEVERQLRGLPRERGIVQIPVDYTPSYRGCIDVTLASSLQRLFLPLTAALLLPLLLGTLLNLAYRHSKPELAYQVLAVFAAVAAVLGLIVSLAFNVTKISVEAARRGAKSESFVGFASAVSASSFAFSLGGSAGPAAQLTAKAAIWGCLIVSAFVM